MKNLVNELLKAIKSEIEAEEFYRKLSKKVSNFVLKEKLNFIANEEKEHRIILEKILRNYDNTTYDYNNIKTEIKNSFDFSEKERISDLFLKAMGLEKESEEFYKKQMKNVKDKKLKETFYYLSIIESSHYFIFKKQYEFYKENEQFEENNPFFNIGP